ncbi:MAG: permease-like cell division protein FtsX [Tidjanibacter sp.]|nr:permease-like cell division protein FtsX [Tidjanibacter sp.]
MSSGKELRRKVRGSYAISTVSIALVLFLVASVGYIIWNLSKATDNIKERMTLYVMMEPTAEDAVVEEVGAKLLTTEGVREAKFISKSEAAADFKNFAGGNFEEFLDYNPLPASYEVRLVASESPKELVAKIESVAMEWEGVDEVIYQQGMVESMDANLGRFKLLLVVFGAVLLLISLILLKNTIRMSVFSRREIIATMKLVGATKSFIKRPFIASSFWMGLAASAIASAMFWAMIVALSEGVPYLVLISGGRVMAMMFGGIVVGGVAISMLFTSLTLGKFIRMNSAKVHIY